MDDPLRQMMYTDALMGLASGYVDDINRDILSYAPLPSEFTDPFAARDMDLAGVMEMTGKAMTAWIEESQKTNYFSKHFTDLSKLIMNGTVTMARGLMSLRNCGEDLSSAPMSIGDLISLGSCQFRKSYLGVLQTVKSYPEISRRLLINQLGWANTLLRLFKTKEKLETPAVVKTAAPLIGISEQNVTESVPQKTLQNDSQKALKASDAEAFSDIAAIFEPGAYSAPRAYKSLDNSPASQTRNRIPANKETAETARKAQSLNVQPSLQPLQPAPENKEQHDNTIPQIKAKEITELSGTETEIPAAREDIPVKVTSEPAPEASAENRTEDQENEEKTGSGEQVPPNAGHQSSGQQISENDIPEPDPDHPPDETDMPQWFHILSRAYAREVPGSRKDTVTFTEDEVLLLVNDPDFCFRFPDIADTLRPVAERIRQRPHTAGSRAADP